MPEAFRAKKMPVHALHAAVNNDPGNACFREHKAPPLEVEIERGDGNAETKIMVQIQMLKKNVSKDWDRFEKHKHAKSIDETPPGANWQDLILDFKGFAQRIPWMKICPRLPNDRHEKEHRIGNRKRARLPRCRLHRCYHKFLLLTVRPRHQSRNERNSRRGMETWKHGCLKD